MTMEVTVDDAIKSRRTTSRQTSRELLHPALEDIDPSTKFLYTPHTISGLLIGLVILIYTSRALNPPDLSSDPLQAEQTAYFNVKHGITAGCLVFLGYSFLQGPSTSMVRPHPAVWRIIHGMIIIYLLALVFLLFQDVDDARQLLKHLYPELGVDLGERAYGADCRLYIKGQGINWTVIKATLFDEFVVAHTVGWWCKALVIRDWAMLWVLSFGFELMELTFQHMLPNFNECWWDSWVLDVAVCNLIGIYVGMKTVRWFGSRTYNWSGLSQQKTVMDKAKRSLLQFSPHSWDDFDWRLTSSPMRCIHCLFPVVLILLMEVNAFFLKYVLWIPPLNPLNTYRLLLLFLGALPATKEYYTFMDSDESDIFNKLGPFAWLATAVALAETLLCVKFGAGMFSAPWPSRVLYAWGISGALFVSFMTMWGISIRQREQRRKAKLN